MNQPSTTNPPDSAGEDILFECPQCGKSLEIDARGAGYLIVCPNCKNEIQVPAWNADGSEPETEVDDASRERILIEEMLHQLQDKVSRLEQRQTSDDLCLQRIGDELVIIQAALDRITEIVDSRKVAG